MALQPGRRYPPINRWRGRVQGAKGKGSQQEILLDQVDGLGQDDGEIGLAVTVQITLNARLASGPLEPHLSLVA